MLVSSFLSNCDSQLNLGLPNKSSVWTMTWSKVQIFGEVMFVTKKVVILSHWVRYYAFSLAQNASTKRVYKSSQYQINLLFQWKKMDFFCLFKLFDKCLQYSVWWSNSWSMGYCKSYFLNLYWEIFGDVLLMIVKVFLERSGE